MFLSHNPSPEDKEAAAVTIETASKTGAGLGTLFVTDANRSGFVNAKEVAIIWNRLIALRAEIVPKKDAWLHSGDRCSNFKSVEKINCSALRKALSVPQGIQERD